MKWLILVGLVNQFITKLVLIKETRWNFMKINKFKLLGFSLLFASILAQACTTILIGKGLTLNKSVIHAHNEDMGFSAVGRLWHVNAKTHDAGSTLDVPYMTIPQVKNSHAYWASGNAQASTGLGLSSDVKPYDSVLVGINQWGVTMSCNWMHSKEKVQDKKGIRRYAIRELILERAKTARQAVQIIGDFIEEYGQADWGGLDYNVADTNEAWVVETTSNHWVAKRINDDEIWVVANRFTITTDFDLSSKDLIDNAIKQGWYNPNTDGKFNFRAAYGKLDKINQDYDIKRENRAKNLLENKEGTLTAEDLFLVLRDRYEGSDAFTKPQKIENWRETSEGKHIPRTISSNLGQSSSVAVLRRDMPIEVGAMMWYAMVSPQFSGYFPIYAGTNKIPQEMQNNTSINNKDSAWWTFKNLQKIGTENFNSTFPVVNNFWKANHQEIVVKQKAVESEALKLISKGEHKKAMKLLNTFSYSQAKNVLYHGRRLLNYYKPL